MSTNLSLFDDTKTVLADSIRLTIESLCAYAKRYRHWVIAYSGGKDSTTVVTIVAHLIETGEIPEPASLTVLFADTRMELPPLWAAAVRVLEELRARGIRTQVVLPPMDDRFMVYMLGRGVPPPNNKTLRWCTSQIKIEPMHAALKQLRAEIGEKLLMLTGVRLGESAARDERIVTSCSRDNTECGQGWLQIHTPGAVADTLAPIVHWRVCHVWAWLISHAPAHGFPTRDVALAYGGDEAEEINARTGCTGCPLASKDKALESVIKLPDWEYLAPLMRLRPLYEELRFTRRFRHRKADVELLKDGSIGHNPQRIGPLTLEARWYGLKQVVDIEYQVNEEARRLGRPLISLIDIEEEDRIIELITARTFPNKWDGTEPTADIPIDRRFSDGTVQPMLLEMPDAD